MTGMAHFCSTCFECYDRELTVIFQKYKKVNWKWK